MVRVYKSKATRKTYSQDILDQAVFQISGGKSLRSVAKELNIEKMYLYRYMKKEGNKKPGRQTALSLDSETQLTNNLTTMAKWGFSLGKAEVLDIVKEFVEEHALNVPFKDGRPGHDWFKGFCHRNNLSLKNMEPLETSRKNVTGDPFIIYGFYDLLEKEVRKLGLEDKPSHIFNLDETSFCSDPSRIKRVSGVGQKAHRQAEGSGRDNTTVLACISADGKALPPLIIFQAANLWSSWKGDKDLPGTYYACSDNGWMTSIIFQEYFRKFCEQVKERPLLMVFDGHLTHLDVNTVTYAMEQNVTIIKLPAHTTDLLQPLDKSCFKTLKYVWDLKLVPWYRQNQRKLQKHEFVNILCEIWNEGLKSDNMKAGFRSTGIYPVDRSKYPVTRFDPQKYERYTNAHLTESNLEQHNLDHNDPGPSNSLRISAVQHQGAGPSNSLNISTFQHQGAGPSTAEQASPCSSTSGRLSSPRSFESLLIGRVNRTEAPQKRRRRLDPGAQVATSEEWIRLEKEKKDTRKQKKKKVQEEDTSDEDELAVTLVGNDNNVDDIDLLEPQAEDYEVLEEPENVKAGDFLLASFKGGKRNSTTYKYVVTVTQVFSDGEIEVMGLKTVNDKKTFQQNENDVSVLKKSAILGKLSTPNMTVNGNRFKYSFDKFVDVFEQ